MSPLNGIAIAARAYAAARWHAATLRSREDIARYRRRRLLALGRHLRATMPFYAGIDPAEAETWPILDKAALLAHFAAINVPGMTLDAVRDALGRGESRVDGYTVGCSTGTSGHRGYFVVSDAERYVWLGTLLAKALPTALWRRHRVALALPGFSRLYAAAQGGSRVRLGLFDLAEGVNAWSDRYAAFAPDTVVAPPKVLRLLAERGLIGPGVTAFSAAEVLEPVDSAPIAAATGSPVRQIYMATEGLFAVSCPHGTLHLAEDVVAFEWEPVGDLVQPIVTDFTRRAQAMARYRMNDLLRLSDARCRCGSAYQPIAAVEGRRDDLFWLPDADARSVPITPDILRNALLAADPQIDDFRIVQTGAREIAVAVPAGVDDAAVHGGLVAALARAGTSAEIVVRHGVPPADATKLRRVRCDWRGDQSRISAS